MPHSTVHGDAEVAQSMPCGLRCAFVGGGDIWLTLDGVRASTVYVVMLAHGVCSSHASGVVIARGGGRALHDRGARIHVAVPIHQLVKTDYSIIVAENTKATALACGAIQSDAPY